MVPGQSKTERLFWTAASEIRRIIRSSGSHAERLLEIEQLLHDMRDDALSSEAEAPSQ